VAEFAHDRRVSVRLLNDVVKELVDSGYLAELSDEDGTYVLLRSPEHLKVRDVITTVLTSGVEPAALGLGHLEKEVTEVVAKASQGIEASLAEVTVQDLITH
jgi:DNA-binding IscR family transcriptional regulator